MISVVRRKLTTTEYTALLRDFHFQPREDMAFIIVCCLICWIGFSLISLLPFYVQRNVWLSVVMSIFTTGGIGGYLYGVIRGEKRRCQENSAEIANMQEREYEVVSAILTAGITFEGQDDLGPYWIGSDGEALLILRGQYLYDMSTHQEEDNATLFDRAEFTILRNPATDTMYRLRKQGNKIPVEVVTDEQLNIEYVNLILQQKLPSLVVLPGSLDTWQHQVSIYQCI